MVSRHSRGSAAGNIITLLLLVGIVGLGAWLWLGKKDEAKPRRRTRQSTSAPAKADSGVAKPDGDAPRPIEPVTGTPTLEAANTFVPKDNVLRIDISEYAGYGGLIVANGGLEPNADSFFAKEYGFKVADLDERERDLGSAQQRQARRHRHHRRRAGGARPAVRRRSCRSRSAIRAAPTWSSWIAASRR